MRFREWIGALAIASVVAAPAVAFAQTPGGTGTDDALKSRIEALLKANATLKDDSIDIDVDHGVVTLKGSVDSKAESQRAAQLAKVPGVTKVENKLDVEVAATTGKTPNAAEKTGDAIVDGSKKVAEKTVDGSKKVAGEVEEVVTDSWITSKLKADFVNEDTLKGSSINVDTNEHVVTLKGTVSAAGRARAVEIAKTTKGVKRVIDTLSIAPPK